MSIPSSFRQVAVFLEERRENVIGKWLRTVRRDEQIPTSDRLARHELLDHLPTMLASLADQLRGLDTGEEARKDSQKHGEYRWTQNYSLGELLEELSILREVLGIEFQDYFHQNSALYDEDSRHVATRCLHRFLDLEIAHSVKGFVALQQEQIHATNRSLMEMNERVQTFNTHLEQLDARRLQMLRTVAHELGNHLQGLTIIMSLVKAQVDSGSAREHLEMLSSSVSAMAQLTSQLLEYASLLSGREMVRVEPCDLAQLHGDVSAGLRTLATSKGLGFRSHIDAGLGIVPADRQKLHRICLNLGTNAVKYTPAGEIAVNFLAGGDATWIIEVCDTGVGLAPAEQTRIFQEFYRVPDVQQDQRGAGLGLAITEKLIALLGGSVLVESEPGRGSCFRVTLPKHTPKGDPTEPAA